MYPVFGARVPVPRCKLPPAQLSEDEAGGAAHQGVQAQDQRRLPHLQAAHRIVLLPRQTLPGDQVPRTLLLQHQAQAEAAAAAAEAATGPAAEEADGRHDEDGAHGQHPAGRQQRADERYGGATRCAGGGESRQSHDHRWVSRVL